MPKKPVEVEKVIPEFRIEGGHHIAANLQDEVALREVRGPEPEEFHRTGKFSTTLCIALLLFFGCISLGFESFSFGQDNRWNELVEGEDHIPGDAECVYFQGKTFNLHLHDHIQADLYDSLLRNSPLHTVFLAILTFFLFSACIHLFINLCSQRMHTRSHMSWVLGWLMLGGFINIMNAYILMMLLRSGYKMKYEDAVQHIFEYERQFFKIGIVNGVETITDMFNVTERRARVIHEQTKLLRDIFQICGGFIAPRPGKGKPRVIDEEPSFEVKIRMEFCDRADFEAMGFCQQTATRTSAIALSIILGMLCWFIAYLICCIGWTNDDNDNEIMEETGHHVPAHHIYLELAALDTLHAHDEEHHLHTKVEGSPYYSPAYPEAYRDDWVKFIETNNE